MSNLMFYTKEDRKTKKMKEGHGEIEELLLLLVYIMDSSWTEVTSNLAATKT